jgi:hypothetical protein
LHHEQISFDAPANADHQYLQQPNGADNMSPRKAQSGIRNLPGIKWDGYVQEHAPPPANLSKKWAQLQRKTMNRKLARNFQMFCDNLTDSIEVVRHTVAEAAPPRPQRNPP